jgi:hypothetical protein
MRKRGFFATFEAATRFHQGDRDGHECGFREEREGEHAARRSRDCPRPHPHHERFHIMKLVSEAVDKVRRGEHKEIESIGNGLLTGTRFIWLTSFENLSNKQHERFADLIDSGLETGTA